MSYYTQHKKAKLKKLRTEQKLKRTEFINNDQGLSGFEERLRRGCIVCQILVETIILHRLGMRHGAILRVDLQAAVADVLVFS